MKRRRLYCLLSVGLCVTLLVSSVAVADVKTALTGARNWFYGPNWNPAGAPGSGDDVRLAGSVTSPSVVNISGDASANLLRVGYYSTSGAAELDNNVLKILGSNYASTLTVTGNMLIGAYSSNKGSVLQEANTTVTAGAMYVGSSDEGLYTMQGGTLTVGTGEGHMNVNCLGYSAKGTFQQSGGTANFSTLSIGRGGSGSGVYNLTAGAANVAGTMYVGVDGSGTLNLGDANGGAVTLGDQSGYTADLSISRYNGRGLVQGYANVTMTGTLELSHGGKVIADGYDRDQTLSMKSFTALSNTVNNSADSGWYARNKGRLELTAASVTASGSAYWGENASLDLVNAVKIDATAGTTSGTIDISLLANDRSELGTTSGNIVGVWQIEADTFDFGTGTLGLTFRYDDAAAGASEAGLKLFKTVNGSWIEVSASVDTTANTISASNVDSLSYFAVGYDIAGNVPEPASVSLLAIAGLGVLARKAR